MEAEAYAAAGAVALLELNRSTAPNSLDLALARALYATVDREAAAASIKPAGRHAGDAVADRQVLSRSAAPAATPFTH